MIRGLPSFVAIILTLTLPVGHALERPNILWITVEDMSPTLGCWGDTYAHTPNIDQLAAESVRFTNVFATAPVCSPSRSCLITGVYAQTLGTHPMRSDYPIPETIPAWPALLRDAGYHTTNNVKTDYNTSSEPRLIRQAWDRNDDQADWRDRPEKDTPFFAVVNDMTTHQSRSMVWPYDEFKSQIQAKLPPEAIHHPDHAPLPPFYPDTPVVRRTLARHYDCVSLMDRHTGDLLRRLEKDGLTENTIVFFFSDHGSGLPRHKRVLHDSGMQVPLLIRFPPRYQHLAPAKPGDTVDDLISFVDFPPSVLSLLEIPIPEHMQGSPFLGPQKASPRSWVYGARDRVDEVFDFARSLRTRQYLYIRNYMPHFGWNQRSVYPDQGEIRQAFYALDPATASPPVRAFIQDSRPREELYHIESDPHQIHNLAGDPAHAEALNDLRQTLLDTAASIRDLGYLPEAQLAELAKTQPPYEALREQPSPFSMETLIRQAEAAFRPEPVTQEELLENLQSLDALAVLTAARRLQLAPDRSPDILAAAKATLERWRDRSDTSLALFIRFSCEAILGVQSRY